MRAVVALGLAAMMLAGCGVRGSLESPPEAKTTASADTAEGKPAGATAKPHKPFILDGLLR